MNVRTEGQTGQRHNAFGGPYDGQQRHEIVYSYI